MKRGEIYWAELDAPKGSEPGDRRPVLIIQCDRYNSSRLPTVLVATITTNLNLAKFPGNTLIYANETGLPKESVVNVSQIMTINRSRLTSLIGELDPTAQFSVDNGLRLAFDLGQ
jgi:mRNA interferase MazF